jgi:hypothetical protein
MNTSASNKDAKLIAEAYMEVLKPSTEKQYDKSSNSPYGRGEADSYYRRAQTPHYYIKNADGSNRRVEEGDMTPEEVEAYYAGYRDNEKESHFKDYEGDAR